MSQRLGFGVFLAPHHPIGETLPSNSNVISNSQHGLTGCNTMNSGSANTIPQAGKQSARQKCSSWQRENELTAFDSEQA